VSNVPNSLQLELNELADALTAVRTLAEVGSLVTSAGRRVTGADGVTLVLREGDECFYFADDAIAPMWKGRRFPSASCISGWVMANRTPVVIADVFADARIPQDVYRQTFVKSMAMVPVRADDPIAAIGAYWARRHKVTTNELSVLQRLAACVAPMSAASSVCPTCDGVGRLIEPAFFRVSYYSCVNGHRWGVDSTNVNRPVSITDTASGISVPE
jgi:hypothetical protein